MPKICDTCGMEVSKMADESELLHCKMATNRVTTQSNNEAKNTHVTALRPRYVTQ